MASLFAVCALFVAAGDRRAGAGGIHIRYGPDAPEKLAAANVIYYEGVLNLEHHRPIAFHEEHPFYTRMFDDPAMIEKLEMRWEAHEQRFEYWHDCLWKVLDGYRATHPGPSPAIPIAYESPLTLGYDSLGGIVAGSGINSNSSNPDPHGGGGGGGGTAIGVLSVPEPSSGVLMVLGLAVAASWRVARHRRAS